MTNFQQINPERFGSIKTFFSIAFLFLISFGSFSSETLEENNQVFIPVSSDITTCQVQVGAAPASITFGEYFTNMFDNSRWPARWTCGEWAENEGWLYIASDLTIFFAYLSIPFMLLWYVRKARLGKLRWLVALFGAFILLCGFTHLVDVILFWNPIYRFSGFVKLITGIVSMGTAVVLGYVMPIALRYKSPKEMDEEINERKKLQDIFNLFLKYSPGATAMFDREMNYIMVNDNWYKDYNLENIDLVGKCHFSIFPEILNLTDRLEDYQRVMKGETISKAKETIVVSGKTEIYRLQLRPWYNVDGSIGGLIQLTEKLTETERLKNELIQAAERTAHHMRTIVELSSIARIGTWEYDIEKSTSLWSDVMYNINELEQGAPIDPIEAIAYFKQDHKLLEDLLLKAKKQGKAFDIETKLETRKGNELWVRVVAQPVFDKKGNVIMLKGICQDIDSSKKGEILLAESNKILETEVAKRTNELRSTIDDLKSTQTQLVESEKLASLGQLSAGVAHEINTPLGAINASIGSLQDSFWKSLNLFKDLKAQLGQTELEMLYHIIENNANHKDRLSTREERRLKREIIKTLEAWGIENNYPLADRLVDMGIREDIQSFKNLILHSQSEPILALAYHLINESNSAKNIELAVQKASKTVYALKSFSRFEDSDELEVIDLRENIDTVLTLYNNQLKQGITVTKKYPDDVFELECHPDKLIQVWTNLVHNAMHSMDYQGELTILLKNEDESILVAIKDTGSGIPPEVQPKIFDAFFTTKPTGEGSGLGLDIVKKIIEEHDGEIWFDTSENGTVFFVRLAKKQKI